MSEPGGKQNGLKVSILGLHFTLIGLAAEAAFPLFLLGIAVSLFGLTID
ncbi:hypothetical protein [Natronosalvus rutilus]|uniref:Uncharacterized protein n=1 Tax=Natronosalvus rutilus TaxID=2953753 RepID=A0A9E7NDP1_9EURY|nr:hypothetical protein [Natronosalvus rutilus]UTF55103.1 hypothetical protein NGM29_07590 [Natronosalvus rutilus]